MELYKPYRILNNNLTLEQRTLLRGMRPMIATPMYGGQCFGQYTNALIATIKSAVEIDCNVTTDFIYNESLIQRARNSLVHTFLKSDCTHLFFIDADIGFGPSQFFEILLAMHYEKRQLLAGTYPRKTINWAAVRAAIEAGKPDAFLPHAAGFNIFQVNKGEKVEIALNDLVKVRYVGTGFLCIAREVFTTLQTKFPEMYTKSNLVDGRTPMEEKIWTFFDCKPSPEPERYYRSEDYYFSDICREAGIETYAAPWVVLEHNGFFTYNGCVFCSNGVYVHDMLVPETKP